MKVVLCLLALIVSWPDLAQAQPARWLPMGHADYPRTDYGRSGPTPLYYAPGSYVMYALRGPHTYTYRNGVRVWYGIVPAFAPVMTTTAIAPPGPPVAAPASPGPRVYRTASGVRVWYGQ